MAEKKLRQQELHVIKREREMLEGERRQLAQQKDLQKLVEYEPMLESVKGLKDYGITLEVLKQYLNMVEDKAVNECTSPKAAAMKQLNDYNILFNIISL
jgi:hypothetical protein